MEHDRILSNIRKHIALDSGEQEHFTGLLKYRELAKKDLILRGHESCKYINFVHSGVLRAYYLNNSGKESTIMFAVTDWWVTDMYSFISGHPAMLTIQAEAHSQIWQLSKQKLDELYLKVPKFERFFRIIMQNAYVREQLRVIQNLSLPAEERYANFLTKYPEVVACVTQKQLASYLGITPEFLSTIRRKKG